MKTITLVTGALLGAVAIAGSPSHVRAQWGIAPYAGYNIDAQELHLGAAAQFTLPAKIGTVQLTATPGVDLYPFVGSGASLYMFYFDLGYPIETTSTLAPYVGAGLSVTHASASVTIPGLGTISSSSTNVGLNLKGGTFFNKGKPMRPFAEAVLVISTGSTLLLRGGVQFTVGKKR